VVINPPGLFSKSSETTLHFFIVLSLANALCVTSSCLIALVQLSRDNL
jgi:hypothetical protein